MPEQYGVGIAWQATPDLATQVGRLVAAFMVCDAADRQTLLRSAEFRAGHIPGARSLPLWEDGLDVRLADLRDFQVEDPRRVIVLYCTGSACTDSHDLAQRLFALGLPNLRIYTGGYPIDGLPEAFAFFGRGTVFGIQTPVIIMGAGKTLALMPPMYL